MDLISSSNMGVILLSVLTTSFLGSTHCMGMCGGIVFIVNESFLTLFFYHLGRLLSYITLVLISTLISSTLLAPITTTALGLIAPLSIGLIFIYMGIKIFQGKSLHIQLPKFTQKILQKSVKNKTHQKEIKTFLIGLSSIFLPCGWLYGFVFGAAATQDLKLSVMMIFTFWLGTLPLLALTPTLIQKFITPLKKRFPILASLMLIFAGLFTIVMAVKKVV